MGSFHERAPDSPSVILTDANGSAIDLDAADNFQDLIFMFGGDRKVKQLVGLETEERSAEQDLAFRADVKRLRQRLRDQRRGLLNPSGFYVQYWDMVTALALMFTLFVTPLEVGVDLTTKLDGLFVVNQCVACIFVCDIVVQFFLPTKMGQHGEYERRHLVLAYAYAKTWLLIDVVSVIPFDILVLIGAVSGPVKVVKLLRVLRLLKLVKVRHERPHLHPQHTDSLHMVLSTALSADTFEASLTLRDGRCCARRRSSNDGRARSPSRAPRCPSRRGRLPPWSPCTGLPAAGRCWPTCRARSAARTMRSSRRRLRAAWARAR